MSVTATTLRRSSAIMPVWLAIAAGLAGLGLIFLPECRTAVQIWISSTAYGHCFLVLPIAAYLAWDRRDTVRGMAPRPSPALLLLGLPLPFAWFAAERLGIMEGRQLIVIGFVELLFLVLLGWRLFYAMLGPLLYLIFLVPFGEFLTPALQSFTAWFIDFGLTALAIPHYSDNMVVEVSGGTFYVAEACAGLRFLIASVAFGVFYGLLNYQSAGRRTAFMAASIIVPIIANGFRALGIVLLGYVLGSAEAAAADHLIYGWFFFSAVTLLLVAAGLPFREPAAPARVAPPSLRGRTGKLWPAAPVLALAAIGPAAATALDRLAPPAHFAAAPTLVAPQGCQLEPLVTATDRATTTFVCGPRRWTMTLQVISPRSTGGTLTETRRRLIGPLDPEGVTTVALHPIPPTAGAWSAISSQDPSTIAGVAVWVRGKPAAGGLVQRLLQARDSVFGNQTPPLLAVIATNPGHRLPPPVNDALIAELAHIVAAQPDLNAEVLQLTDPASK